MLCTVATESTLISDKHTEWKRIIRCSSTNEIARTTLRFSPIVFQQIMRAHVKHKGVLMSKVCGSRKSSSDEVYQSKIAV
jgi:hypothetical protein